MALRNRSIPVRRAQLLAAGFAVAALGLAACGGSTGGSGGGGGGGGGGSFSLRLSSDVPATSAAGLADALFAKKVEEYTDGKVKVRVYPLSQLGAEATVLSGVQTGSIDFADFYTGSIVGQLPALGLYSLPFLIPSEQGAAQLFTSTVTKNVLASLASKHVRGLYVASNGPFEVIAKKAITAPSDFSGLKLRVNTDPISTAMLKAVGATAVPLPSLQVYSALQQGLVTGSISAPAGMVSLKWYEVAKQLSQLDPQWDAQLMTVSPTTWKRLPAKYQAEITKAAAATMADNKTTALTATNSNLALLKKSNVTFTVPDKAPFRAIETKIYPQFASSIGQSTIDAAIKVETAS